MADIFDMVDTWNNAGTTFAAIKMNVTDTASAANSLLLDLQVGGISRAFITKVGRFISTLEGAGGAYVVNSAAFDTIGGGRATIFISNATAAEFHGTGFGTYGAGLVMAGSGYLGITTATGVASDADVMLARDAADIFAQRRGTNAQTKRVYGTFTDASNYRRVSPGMATAGIAALAPEGAGTGASGNVLHISGLPTSNPGPGILWNDAGTVKVGT